MKLKIKKILFDIKSPYYNNKLSNISSTEIYWINLLKNILDKDKNNCYYVLINNFDNKYLFKEYKNINVIYTKIKNPIILDNIMIPYYSLKYNIDLIHFTKSSTCYFPIFWKKILSTIHGLIYKVMPQKSSYIENIYWRFNAKISYKIANKIITVSESDKNDLISDWCNNNKIDVIHIWLDKKFFDKYNDLYLLDKYNLNKGKYFIQIWGISKKKNQIFTIEVINEFLQKNKNYKIVFIWPIADKEYKKELDIYISKNNIINQVIFTWWINQNNDFEKFISLITNSLIAFFPSIYEWFWIPPLEIISRGIPVLISNKWSLPEIYWVEDTLELDIDIWKKEFSKLINLEDYKTEFCNKQKILLENYKWGNLAVKYINLYNKI